MSAVEGMLVGNGGITSVIYQLISLLSYWMAARCATEGFNTTYAVPRVLVASYLGHSLNCLGTRLRNGRLK